MIYLVRHAKAGDPSRWRGDDRLRPLTAAGRRQAAALAGRLGSFPVRRVVSSPYLRCLQTVEPLAAARGLDLESSEALAESSSGTLREMLREMAEEDVVLCSHGDLIGDLVCELAEDGLLAAADCRWQKGSTWVLDLGGNGVRGATYLEPPA